MNAKKERDLLIENLKNHAERKAKTIKEYRALADFVENLPIALLVKWVMAEEEAHRRLMCRMIDVLRQLSHETNGNGSHRGQLERDKILFHADRLRLLEERFAADCLSLKSQACWDAAELIDIFVDAIRMDSEKHQRILSAVEKVFALQ